MHKDALCAVVYFQLLRWCFAGNKKILTNF